MYIPYEYWSWLVCMTLRVGCKKLHEFCASKATRLHQLQGPCGTYNPLLSFQGMLEPVFGYNRVTTPGHSSTVQAASVCERPLYDRELLKHAGFVEKMS